MSCKGFESRLVQCEPSVGNATGSKAQDRKGTRLSYVLNPVGGLLRTMQL